mgnify:CR=1 FL=1
MKALTNQIAIVTGAGSGIGKAIARLFAEEGAKLILSDIRHENIEAVAAEIKINGGTAFCFPADVSKKKDVDLLIDHTLKTYGRLDILVNNAGIMDNFAPVAEVTDKLWDNVIGTNLTGAFYTSRVATKLFLEQQNGNIINIASIAGLTGGRAGCAYTVSKHALIGLTKSIGYQYADKGIRCNAIAPGGINTNILHDVEFNPFGFDRMNAGSSNMPSSGEPEDIAAIALFLASEKSKFMNGAVVTADGGWTAY